MPEKIGKQNKKTGGGKNEEILEGFTIGRADNGL